MELNVHFYLHPPEPRFGDPVVQRLDQMLALLQKIAKGVLQTFSIPFPPASRSWTNRP